MDFEGPHYDPTLFGPAGKMMRLHKGAKASEPPPPQKPILPPPPPPEKGTLATTVGQAKERNPNKTSRGFTSTILTTGIKTGFGGKSILGG
jgi:hypothetical protein